MIIGGITRIFVGGGNVGDVEQLSLRGQVEVAGFDRTKETVVGIDKIHGQISRPNVPRITATISRIANQTELATRFNTLRDFQGGTVTVITAGGDTFELRDAVVEGEVSLNPESAEMSITFTGTEITQTR